MTSLGGVRRTTFPERILPGLMLVAGLVGLLASLALTIEKLAALASPAYRPVCNLNPIFSCSAVSDSSQSMVFGFYNPLLGIVGFSGVVAIGAGLLAGAKFKRWFWLSLQGGLTFAMAFVTWLQFESLYRIGALCLFCMMAWAATGPLFWYLTLANLGEGRLTAPKRLRGAIAFANRHHADILLLWFLVIAALILKRFWYYWSLSI